MKAQEKGKEEEVKKILARLKEIFGKKYFSEVKSEILKLFDEQKIEIYLNFYDSLDCHGVDIFLSDRSYSFECERKTFLWWKWWKIELVE